MIAGSAVSLHFFLKGQYLLTIIIEALSAAPVLFCFTVRRKKSLKSRLDLPLVTVIAHLYCLSLGNIDVKGLISSIAENREYDVYSRVFRRILHLATSFGYGFTKAIGLIARTVKPPLRDILIRFSEAMGARAPKEHLSLEMSTVTEEYSGEYERMAESLKVLGGIYTSVMSVSALAVMVSSLLTIFMENVQIPLITYILTMLIQSTMVAALKSATPKERLIYIGRNPPRIYNLFKMSLLSMLVALILPAAAAAYMGYEGIPYALIGAGGVLLAPGMLAYKLESYVNSIDKFYPTFIKTLGESLSSTTDYRSALSYALHMELGALRRHVQRALNRIKILTDAEEALNLLASETASYQVHMLNTIFAEAFRAGSNPLEVGRILSGLAIRLLELRNKWKVTARSFETIIIILQPIVVALLVILTTLAAFFSQTITRLPFFELGYIPVPLVRYGTMSIILALAVLNSLSINFIRGGFKGTSLLYIGILLIESGAAWMGTSKLMEILLSRFAEGIELPF